jgi:signal transduction histidine kinase
VRLRIAPLSWLTGWHWALAVPPLALAVVASAGALTRNRLGEIGGWLPLAIVLLAGSELHDSLWPSAYGNSMLMNTADVLRLAMAGVVAVGGALELRRVAGERAALLAAERNHARRLEEETARLEELAALKADFTAMVAHELGYPLSAIRRLSELLGKEGLDPELRRHSLATIIKEVGALDARVADVQATAAAERDGFAVDLRPVELGAILDDAVMLGSAHAGGRPPLETVLDRVDPRDRVLADRIASARCCATCSATRPSTPTPARRSRSARPGPDGASASR